MNMQHERLSLALQGKLQHPLANFEITVTVLQ